ncbi:MAG: PAS domain-containing protein [Gemmatimonadales bacterium]|nr:MAG: PAS domain-containing protein [Gemmatimonadales bacterium]
MESHATSPEASESSDPATPAKRISICAWCGTPINRTASQLKHEVISEDASGDRGQTTETHGICTLCIADLGVYPIESLMDYDRESFDDLPFGIVEVDAQGRVLTYNKWEEELADRSRSQTLGRNFFSEVAPCTGVAEFEGRFRELVAAGVPAREQLDFLFRFPGGDTLVSVALTWAPDLGRGFVLVQKVGE